MREPHPYDPNCPDCIPALLNVTTGEAYPREHPLMVKILRGWFAAPFIQRRAYMAVTLDNSRSEDDLRNASPLFEMMERVVQQAKSN